MNIGNESDADMVGQVPATAYTLLDFAPNGRLYHSVYCANDLPKMEEKSVYWTEGVFDVARRAKKGPEEEDLRRYRRQSYRKVYQS